MLWLYRILFLPLLLVASPFYLLRMKRRGGYRRHFSHRLGAVPVFNEKRSNVKRIWLQAVSVGEMLAIAPLLEALKRDQSVEVYLTTTTSTGYKLARDRYQELTLGIGYFPIDWWPFSWRAWRNIRPDLVILTEGERWPEHLRQASTRRVPVLCVNARMSDRSFRRMAKWRVAAMPLLRGITRVLACSEHDARRFVELGFPPAAVTTVGNIKLDLTVPEVSAAEREQLRAELGFGSEPILLGSSTWPGEESALVSAYRAVSALGTRCRLLLVPRHAERRRDIEDELNASGLTYHFRSRGPAPKAVDVCVADTTGELRKLTQLAEIAFIGKSLPPHGEGQTPVEAAALGVPILFGRGMSNFRVIARELVDSGAAEVVGTATDLPGAVQRLFTDDEKRQGMGRAGREWHRASQGAVQRTLAILREELARL